MSETSKLLHRAVTTEFNRLLKDELRTAIRENRVGEFDSDVAKSRCRAAVVEAVTGILDTLESDA